MDSPRSSPAGDDVDEKRYTTSYKKGKGVDLGLASQSNEGQTTEDIPIAGTGTDHTRSP